MSRFLLFFVIFVGLGLTIWQIASRSSGAYERMLVQRVENGLEVLGYDWARIRADGLQLELHGHAPDTFARELALQSARATATVASVTSYATATLAPPERRDPIRVEFLRDATGVTMTGQTANREMRTHLNDRLTGGDTGLTVRDLTGIQAAPPPRNWGAEIDVAILAATKLANAYVVMEPGQVLIDGQASDAKDRAQLITTLREAAGEVVLLNLRIRIPESVIAPFAFTAEKRPGGEIRVETCAVRDEAEDQAVRSALDPNGQKPAFAICQVGLGGPDGDWPGAITSAIAALNALPAGRVDIEYRHIRLTGAPPTLAEDFDPVVEKLEQATPAGYTLMTSLQGDDIATRTEIARDLYWMKLDRTEKGVDLSGQVPDAKAATAIRAYALAIFGANSVTGELVVIDAPAPRHWQIAALAMVDQLALSTGGSAQIAGHAITVSGTLTDPGLVRLIQRELERGLPNFDIMTRFTIDLPAQLAAIPMPGPRCADQLGAVHRARLIEFSTGSARITKESGPVLDALARIFERCTDDRIEIGGHTDSQGAEDLNQRISQARAEAVVAALKKRGVAASRIVAKGYGETVPVASNQTEDGRARNRRIEFKPAPKLAIAPETVTDADAEPDTDADPPETTDTPAPDADKARD